VKAHLEVYAAEEEMLSAVRRNAELVRDIERFRAEARELRGAAVDESLLDQYAARVKLIEGMYRKINATEAALRPVLGGAKAAAVAEQLEQQLELALSAGPELFAEGKGHGM
jgi:anaerobic glycerol-3-phosphate dehydrogenase